MIEKLVWKNSKPLIKMYQGTLNGPIDSTNLRNTMNKVRFGLILSDSPFCQMVNNLMPEGRKVEFADAIWNLNQIMGGFMYDINTKYGKLHLPNYDYFADLFNKITAKQEAGMEVKDAVNAVDPNIATDFLDSIQSSIQLNLLTGKNFGITPPTLSKTDTNPLKGPSSKNFNK